MHSETLFSELTVDGTSTILSGNNLIGNKTYKKTNVVAPP